jgi:hypothetical protein
MIPKRQLLTQQEKNNLIGSKTPSMKKGGDLSSIYPTKMKDCGCSKK